METLKNYVDWKLAHSDKTATAEGCPLVMENCKANKRMKQLEVYGDCFQSQIPSPDNPSEVQSVGDIFNSITKVSQGTSTFTFLQKWKDVSKIRLTAKINTSMLGRNHILFCTKGGSWIGLDKTNYTTNTWNFINGFTNTSASILPDKFINNEINTIEFSFNNTNDTYISNVWDAAWSAEITYYRIQFYDSLNSLIGDYYPISLYMMYDTVSETTITASQKSQYNNYTEQYKVPIKIRGKNLLDGSFLSKISSITYQDGWYQGSAYSLLDYTTKNKNISGFFKPNTQYTFSWTVNTRASGLGFVVYYTDGTNIRLAKASSTNTDLYLTGTSQVGKSIDYATIDYGANGTCKIKNIQIEKGTTVTNYEPYIEPITQNIYLDEPLRKVGDYADYIDFKNQKVVRKVKEEDISCQLPKTIAKTTIIEVGTSLPPSNIKGKYIIK